MRRVGGRQRRGRPDLAKHGPWKNRREPPQTWEKKAWHGGAPLINSRRSFINLTTSSAPSPRWPWCGEERGRNCVRLQVLCPGPAWLESYLEPLPVCSRRAHPLRLPGLAASSPMAPAYEGGHRRAMPPRPRSRPLQRPRSRGRPSSRAKQEDDGSSFFFSFTLLVGSRPPPSRRKTVFHAKPLGLPWGEETTAWQRIGGCRRRRRGL